MTVRDALAGALLATAMGIAVVFSASFAFAADAEPSAAEIYWRYRKDRDPKVRAKAVAQLEKARGADVVEALVAAVQDEDRKVRRRAARAFDEKRDREDEIAAFVKYGLKPRDERVRVHTVRALAAAGPRAREALVGALSDRHPDVRAAAAEGLGGLKDAASCPALHERLTDRSGLVRAAACEAIGKCLGAKAAGTAAAVLRADRAFEARVAAADVLALAPGADTVEHLGYGLRDSSWSVRLASAEALATGRNEESERAAVAALVKALEREERLRLRGAISDVLHQLTGIDFGPDPPRWTAWFAEAGAQFDLPRRRPKRKRAGGGTTYSHLLDLPIESDHVCFVLDNSHSMSDPLRFGVERTKRNALLEAFEHTVNRMPLGSRMNLIPFGTEPMPYRDALFLATRQMRRSAIRYLSKRVPDGRTNLFDSLALALSDPGVDTIVLVTDGAPSEGLHKNRRSILSGIARHNRYRRARVHAVEVGAKNTSPRWRGFMQQLAHSTGGTYLAR